jgi:hypothetical protein
MGDKCHRATPFRCMRQTYYFSRLPSVQPYQRVRYSSGSKWPAWRYHLFEYGADTAAKPGKYSLFIHGPPVRTASSVMSGYFDEQSGSVATCIAT